MLEVSGSHISKLNDGDLRGLVTQLCEAELHRCGLPISAVTAGGDQDAPDGGIDVRIRLPVGSDCLDFIPKPNTGFQVKRSDMQPKAIAREMRPKGALRATIRELATSEGAYVIVSSKGTTADASLKNRCRAMREATSDLPAGRSLHLDFYDRDRLASWVRRYPGVSLWLRERIGEPLSGWRGYGNWAFGDPVDSDYLLDDTGRLASKQSGGSDPMPIEHGITTMRQILSRPGGVIRFIGLSGLGKTRLVQALFDGRIGTDALDRAMVAYTDQGLEPNPSPRDMLHRLGASGVRAIVVVDNCNPTTHRALTQIVSEHRGTLSLITVEYDVADDEPEETQVFQLEPASEKVLSSVLERLAPQVSKIDRRRIVDFSGGNARVALALASTVRSQENLGVLNDAALFERLFHQNHDSGADLMRAAEACSLVYSFDGETLEGKSAELPVLGELANLSVRELFRHIGDLRSRDLVQRRSQWRAILPHAIANRLARQALERIPTQVVTESFTAKGRERLLHSFGRRLGYLHDSEPARRIAESWLNNSAELANPARLNVLGMTLFHSVAPLAPTLALQRIAEAALGDDGAAFLSPTAPHRQRWIALLRTLAYDPELFDRCALLLARFFAAEPEGHNSDSVCDTFRELFHLYLSGTHALAEQRLDVIRRLLDSREARLQTCALEGLDAMLEAHHFSSGHDFSFGARSRDFGWQPKTHGEVVAWFRAALAVARHVAMAVTPHRDRVREILARHFQALSTNVGIDDELEALARELVAHDGWPDGWFAIRRTIRFGAKGMVPERLQRLRRLEFELRPRDLVQRIHALVLSRIDHPLDLDDPAEESESGNGRTNSWKKANQIVEELGRDVATTSHILSQLLPECLKRGPGNRWGFGRGLALGTPDLAILWQQMREVLVRAQADERDFSLMQGFIAAAADRDADAANRILDEAIADPLLGPQFPLLQASIRIDDAGAERVVTSLLLCLAEASAYSQLSAGLLVDAIPPQSYKRIVWGIASLAKGYSVAVDLVGMRLFSFKSEKREIDEETISLARELLLQFDFNRDDDNLTHHLNEIALVCLEGSDGHDTAVKLCTNFARALSDYRTAAWRYGQLAGTLFRLQPQVALEILLSVDSKTGHGRLPSSLAVDNESPVNCAPRDVLLSWASQGPADRYPKLAKEVRLFERNSTAPDLAWSPLALHLLEHAPNRGTILEAFSWRLRPMSSSGSYADALTPYLHVVRHLTSHLDPVVAAWARAQASRLMEEIETKRQGERRVDGSFE